MGPTGIPGENLHVLGRSQTPPERRAGITASKTGITE